MDLHGVWQKISSIDYDKFTSCPGLIKIFSLSFSFWSKNFSYLICKWVNDSCFHYSGNMRLWLLRIVNSTEILTWISGRAGIHIHDSLMVVAQYTFLLITSYFAGKTFSLSQIYLSNVRVSCMTLGRSVECLWGTLVLSRLRGIQGACNILGQSYSTAHVNSASWLSVSSRIG